VRKHSLGTTLERIAHLVLFQVPAGNMLSQNLAPRRIRRFQILPQSDVRTNSGERETAVEQEARKAGALRLVRILE
jgi:hypothetical protein